MTLQSPLPNRLLYFRGHNTGIPCFAFLPPLPSFLETYLYLFQALFLSPQFSGEVPLFSPRQFFLCTGGHPLLLAQELLYLSHSLFFLCFQPLPLCWFCLLGM